MSLTWCHTMFFLFILSDMQTFSFRKIWSVPLAVPFPFIFCSFNPQLCWENIYRCPDVTTMLDWALKNRDTALLRRYMPWYKHRVWALKTTCLSTLAAALRFCCVFCFLVLFRKHCFLFPCLVQKALFYFFILFRKCCVFCFHILFRKRWVLFPPENSRGMYPTRIPYEESSVFSQVDLAHPDLGKFPLFKVSFCFVVISFSLLRLIIDSGPGHGKGCSMSHHM